MKAELLKAKEQLQRWANDGAGALLRSPLKHRTTGALLGVFGFQLHSHDLSFVTEPVEADFGDGEPVLFEKTGDLEVTVTGIDCPGTLTYLSEGFQQFHFKVLSAAGQRLLTRQGSHFLLTTEGPKMDQLLALYEFFLFDPGLLPARRVAFDRVVDVVVEASFDESGLLQPVTEVLARHGVNLRQFRADRGFGFVKELTGQDAAVDMFARMEVPFGLELDQLHEELLDVVTSGSQVTLRGVHGLVGGKLGKLNFTKSLSK